jgi:uncharacterized membrane protein
LVAIVDIKTPNTEIHPSQDDHYENTEPASKKKLTSAVLARLLASIPMLGLLFFLPAGTLAYWEAWVYMAILFIPITLVAVYLLKNDPALLERRLQMREQQTQQKWIIAFLACTFCSPSHSPVLTNALAGLLRQPGSSWLQT